MATLEQQKLMAVRLCVKLATRKQISSASETKPDGLTVTLTAIYLQHECFLEFSDAVAILPPEQPGYPTNSSAYGTALFGAPFQSILEAPLAYKKMARMLRMMPGDIHEPDVSDIVALCFAIKTPCFISHNLTIPPPNP